MVLQWGIFDPIGSAHLRYDPKVTRAPAPYPGRVYFYRVLRVGIGGERSDAIQVGPLAVEYLVPDGPPDAPPSFAVISTAPDALVLAFEDVASNEDGFDLERREPGGIWASLTTLAANQVVYFDTGLPEGTSYEYRVRAQNTWGESAWLSTSGATSVDLASPVSAVLSEAEILSTTVRASNPFSQILQETQTFDYAYFAAQGRNQSGDGGDYAVRIAVISPNGSAVDWHDVEMQIGNGSQYGEGDFLFGVTPYTAPGLWHVVYEFEDRGSGRPSYAKTVRSLTVLPPDPYRPEITTLVPALALQLGESIDFDLEADYTPILWVADRKLPAGLFLDEVSGRLSGTIEEPFYGEFRIYAVNDGGVSPPIKIVIDANSEIPLPPTELHVVHEASNGALVRWAGHSENSESFQIRTREVFEDGRRSEWSSGAQEVESPAAFVALPPSRSFEVRVSSVNGSSVSTVGAIALVTTLDLPEPLVVDVRGAFDTPQFVKFGSARYDQVTIDSWNNGISPDADVFLITLKDFVTGETLYSSGYLDSPDHVIPLEASRAYQLNFVSGERLADGRIRSSTFQRATFRSPKAPTDEPDINLASLDVSGSVSVGGDAAGSDTVSVVVWYTATDAFEGVIRNYVVDAFGELRLVEDSEMRSELAGGSGSVSFQPVMPLGGGVGTWGVLAVGEDNQGRTKILGSGSFAVETEIATFPILERQRVVVQAGDYSEVPMPVLGGGTRFTTVGEWPSWAQLEEVTGLLRLEPLQVGSFPVTFQVENLLGLSEELTLQIEVVAPPVPAISSISHLDVPLGETFSFRFVADSDPIRYTAVGLPKGLHLNEGSGWIFGAAQEVGTFEVALAVANLWGSGQSTLTIVVDGDPPRFALEPSDIEIESGHDAVLHAAAGGSRPLSYQWYEGFAGDESQPVPGGTTADFSVHGVTWTRYFWAKAINPKGAAFSRTASVRVAPAGPPEIVWQSPDESAPLPRDWRLQVVAVGESPMGYQWFEGMSGDESVPLEGATYSSFQTPILYAPKMYWVRVRNTVGETASETILLDVEPEIDLAAAGDNEGVEADAEGNQPWFGQASESHDGEDALASGPLQDGESASFDLTVEGPGLLTFWSKVSSEPDADFFRFVEDDVVQVERSGEGDWKLHVVELGDGAHALSWRFEKDATLSWGQDRAWVDEIVWTPTCMERLWLDKAAMGAKHAIVTDRLGEVWTWGSAAAGALGHGDGADQPTPRKVSGLSQIVAVRAGPDSSFAIDHAGALFAWGKNDRGQLGTGAAPDEVVVPTPVMLGAGVRAKLVAADTDSTFVVTDGGRVFSCGGNDDGQLGHGDQVARSSFEEIPGLSQIVDLACGTDHVLALNAVGEVFAWGDGLSGQLGLGIAETGKQLSPLAVPDLTGIRSVFATAGASFAVGEDGQLFAWGDPPNGFADGMRRYTPQRTDGVEVLWGDAGGHGLALAVSRDLISWGPDARGQLGNGDADNDGRSVPEGVPLPWPLVDVKASGNNSLGVGADGAIYTWGRGDTQVLGDGSTVDRHEPRAIRGFTLCALPPVFAAADYTFTANGTNPFTADLQVLHSPSSYIVTDLPSWLTLDEETSVITGIPEAQGPVSFSITAENQFGQTTQEISIAVLSPLPLITDHPVSQNFAQGTRVRLDVVTDSATPVTYQWYRGASGDERRLLPGATAAFYYTPVLESMGSYWVKVSNAGGALASETALLTPVGRLPVEEVADSGDSLEWFTQEGAWFGQDVTHSDGESALESAPISDGESAELRSKVAGPGLLTFRWKVSSQAGDRLVFRVNGIEERAIEGEAGWSLAEIWLPHGLQELDWNYLKDANGTDGADRGWVDHVVWTRTCGELRPDMLATGINHVLAVDESGSIWSWGVNYYGQLGHGDGGARYLPEQIQSLSGIRSVYATGNDSYAIGTDGTLYAWGYNQYGQAGVGSTSEVSVPMAIDLGGASARMVAASSLHSLVLTDDGEVFASGRNMVGNLGLGDTTSRTSMTKIPGLSGIVAVATGRGSSHSLALDDQGRVWSWGFNTDGQLGLGFANAANVSPELVPGLDGIAKVFCNGNSSYALDRLGHLWAWGGNGSPGLLGLGDTTRRVSPTMVDTGPAFLRLAFNSDFVFGVSEDRQLWAWGMNHTTFQQLLDGTDSNHSSPIRSTGYPAPLIGVEAGVYTGFALDPVGSIYSWGWGSRFTLGHGNPDTQLQPKKIEALRLCAGNAPVIYSQTESMVVITQQSPELQVNAVSEEPLTYQWYSGESGDSSQPIAMANSDTLVLPPLTDDARVWVLVENDLGVAEGETIRITFNHDGDKDGVDDLWELSNGLDHNDPLDVLRDSDGDGDSEFVEYAIGTRIDDPHSSSGRVMRASGGGPSLEVDLPVPLRPGLTYEIQVSTDLIGWIIISRSNPDGEWQGSASVDISIEGSIQTLTITEPDQGIGLRRYYRLAVGYSD